MTSFKRWFGAGAIVLVALALVACPSLTPRATGHISDMEFELGDKAKEIPNIGNVFQDADDATFTAGSDDDKVATAEIKGGTTLVVTPKGDGTATVTVTATAKNGKTATQRFDVTVTKPDTPVQLAPMPVGAIAAMTFEHGEIDTAKTVSNLGRFFENDDGATYAASSSKATVATAVATADGATLTVTAKAVGEAMVKVTATAKGKAADQEFKVTVRAADAPNAPILTKPMTIDPFPSDADPKTITLSEHFSGATGYRVSSSKPDVVMATEADGVLTLTPQKHGSATVTVTPTNSGGDGRPETVAVTVQARPTFKDDKSLDDLRIIVRGSGGTPTGRKALEKLSTLFEDLDGDSSALKYSTKTSDAKKVQVVKTATAGVNSTNPPTGAPATDKAVEEDGENIVLFGRDAGTVKITVTVTDGDGLKIEPTFEVTVVASNANPTRTTGEGAGTIASVNGNERLKLSGSPASEKVIDDKEIKAYFGDTDLGGTPGDVLTFSVKYVGTTVEPSVSDGVLTLGTETAATDASATATVVPDTWNGDDHGSADKFTVTVTPKKAGSNKIVIIATDLEGKKAIQVFTAQVNNAPEAKGAQASNQLTLGKVDTYSDTTRADALRVGGDAVDLTLVQNNAGYFG